MDGCDEAVPPGMDGFDVPRRLGVVAERHPQVGDDADHGVLGDHRILPDGLEDLVLGDDLTAAFDQEVEQGECMNRHYPAMTLAEVRGLLEPGARVEIEATAVFEWIPAAQ